MLGTQHPAPLPAPTLVFPAAKTGSVRTCHHQNFHRHSEHPGLAHPGLAHLGRARHGRERTSPCTPLYTRSGAFATRYAYDVGEKITAPMKVTIQQAAPSALVPFPSYWAASLSLPEVCLSGVTFHRMVLSYMFPGSLLTIPSPRARR